MAKRRFTRRKKKRKQSQNNIRLKIKNLANIKKNLKTRKYKRIQYGCKNMKGGNAMIDVTSRFGGSIYNNFSYLNNTLGGHSNNSFTNVVDYPKV